MFLIAGVMALVLAACTANEDAGKETGRPDGTRKSAEDFSFGFYAELFQLY